VSERTSVGQDFLVSPDVLQSAQCEFESAGVRPNPLRWWRRYPVSIQKLAKVVLIPLAAVVLLFWALGRYEQGQLAGNHLQLHRVRAGEDLRQLARRYYDNPALWTKIFQANRSRLVGSEGLIEAQLLVIPRRSGNKR